MVTTGEAAKFTHVVNSHATKVRPANAHIVMAHGKHARTLLEARTAVSKRPVENPSFLPYLLPYLGESGWFSVGLGARKPLNTNDFGKWLLRGGGSENRKV
jgi:hypothetical protein